MSEVGKAGADASASETVTEEKTNVLAETVETEEKEGAKSEDDGSEDGEGEEAGTDETKADGEKATGEEDDKPTKSKLRRERQKAKITELEESVRRLSEQVAASDRNQPVAGELGPKPDPAKYTDEREYTADLAAWKTEERILARQAKAHETTSSTIRGDAAAKKMELFKERAMSLSDRYPDIEARVFNDPTLPMSQTMAETIMESEKGPEIAYHLSANREEAQRIKSMPPLAAAAALGRLEAKLSLPKTRTETKAPPPPKTLSGTVKGPAKKLEDMSMAEYRKSRGYD